MPDERRDHRAVQRLPHLHSQNPCQAVRQHHIPQFCRRILVNLPRPAKLAYKEGWLRENVNDYLDRIDWEEPKINYLEIEEVKRLAATPCKVDVLKRASLFACMTGLRIVIFCNSVGRTSRYLPMAATVCASAPRKPRRRRHCL